MGIPWNPQMECFATLNQLAYGESVLMASTKLVREAPVVAALPTNKHQHPLLEQGTCHTQAHQIKHVFRICTSLSPCLCQNIVEHMRCPWAVMCCSTQN